MSQYCIALLGCFCVSRDGVPLPDTLWRNRKARHLFQLLLLSPEFRQSKEQVLDALWPHLPLNAGSNNLYGTLHAIRRHAGGLVALTDGVVHLNLPPGSEVDAVLFAESAEAALRSRTERALRDALALYGGVLLPNELYEEWAAAPRERLSLLHGRLLHTLAEVLALEGRDGEALATLAQILADDPLEESASQRLMLLYARAGARAEALAGFERLRQGLARDLELEPLPETVALATAIRDGTLSDLPLRAWGLAAFAPGRASTRTLPFPWPLPPLAGQADLLAILESNRRQAQDGCGRVLLLTGDMGVGKTRLAHEILARAHAQGALVLAGTGCGQSPAYGPLVEALAPVLTAAHAKRERLDPLARLALDLLLGEEQPGVMASQRAMLPLGLARLIAGLAEEAPVALLLDDLHRADPETIALLPLLARTLSVHPVLLIGTYSRGTLPTDHPLLESVYQLKRAGATRLEIPPLDRPAADRLLQEIGEGYPFDEQLAALLYARSAGNPLFLIEMARHLLATGAVLVAGEWRATTHSLPLPLVLLEAVRQRLRPLPPDVRSVLELAAGMGEQVNIAMLQAASGLAADRLLDVLEEAVHAALLVEEPEALRFAHPLVREAIFAGLPLPRRVALHNRITTVSLHEQDHHAESGREPYGAAPNHKAA